MNLRKNIKEIVKYILPEIDSKDKDVVNSYTDTLIFMFKKYHKEKNNKFIKKNNITVCDNWIHNERVKNNNDNFCPICGALLK